jgi:hypothetical protein
MRLYCVLGLVVLVFTIVGAEKIIQYNDFLPETDLSKPGQIIPLMVGIVIAIDGLATFLRPPAQTNEL